MNESIQSNSDDDEQKCVQNTSKRVTRIELIVAFILFALLALVSDKILFNSMNDRFVIKTDLHDFEDAISALQNAMDSVACKTNRDITNHASLISELNDKIVQMKVIATAGQHDIEHIITQPQHTASTKDIGTNKHDHDTAKYVSMISDLQDQISQIQDHLLQSSERKAKNTENIDVVSVDKIPPGTLTLESHNPKLSEKYEVSSQTNYFERKLQNSNFDRCEENPILSPTNHLNHFEYDERIDRILGVLHSLSSLELLSYPHTPQYKAACWIIFDDMSEMQVINELFIQRYIMAVFLYTMNPDEQDLLPLNTCDHQIVTCNGDDKITKVELSTMNVTGNFRATIPSELSNLFHLEHLKLDNNQLIGNIPPEIGKLTNLKVLNFDFNSLTGTIPTEIGMLGNLTELHLGWNDLTGSIPSEIGRCTWLENFEVIANSMDGTIPKELFGCSNLKVLDLHLNSLIGSIPTEIGQSKELLRIEFENNNFSGQIPTEIGSLSLLEQLWLGENELIGTFPKEIGELSSLEFLIVNQNHLKGTLPEIFGNMSKLNNLVLSNNQFTGTIPRSIWDNDRIENVILQGNDLRGSVPDGICLKTDNFQLDDSVWFANEPKVQCDCCEKATCHIWETSNTIVEGTLRPICQDSNRYNITFFEGYRIEDHIAKVTYTNFHGNASLFNTELCLSPLGCYTLYDRDKVALDYSLNYSESSLKLSQEDTCGTINICGISFDANHPKRKALNHIAQVVFPHFPDFNKLPSELSGAICWTLTEDPLHDEFDICDGTLLQRFVIVLSLFPHRTEADFDEVKHLHTCDWPGITCDSEHKFIEEIFLSNRNVTGPLPPALGLLTRLKKLDMSENELTGTIFPLTFRQAPNLEEIHLGGNRLRGTIPEELFMPPQLKKLNISYNLFAGMLPTDVAYSKSLELVDLENNLFQGSIPNELMACPQLELINLSINNFIGDIPTRIGDLDKLKYLGLNGNRLTGSIPVEIFGATQTEILLLESNLLTGSVPSQIGNLNNATAISLSHNSLKGNIPTELGNLKHIQFLHLHDNLLTGTAPIVTLVDENLINAFISDCGHPSYKLRSPLECKSCTMCCNSNEKCQINQTVEISVETLGFSLVSFFPIFIAVMMYIMFQANKRGYLSCLKDNRSPLSIYNEDSIYCLIFSDNALAWMVYSCTVTLQALAFYIFLKRSNFADANTEWVFTYRCHEHSVECFDEGSRSIFGWFMLVVMLIYFLGEDFIDSTHQLRKAANLLDLRLLISGLTLFFISSLAFATTIGYNVALAESDPELIVNAVFLLFINDMDEQLLSLMDSLVPDWIAQRYLEIEELMKTKTENTTQRVNSENASSIQEHRASITRNTSSIPDRHASVARMDKARFAGLMGSRMNLDI